MMTFALIALAHFFALLSPGPDFFLILRTAISQGRLASIILSTGIALGHLFYLSVVFFGFSLLDEIDILFTVIQIIGVFYLLYLAYHIFKHAKQPLSMTPADSTLISNSASLSRFTCLSQGLAVSLLNPKNAVFYASLMTLLGNQISLATQIFYIVWMTSIVWIWDCFLSVMFSQPFFLQVLSRWMPTLQKMTALIFVGFAFSLSIKLLYAAF